MWYAKNNIMGTSFKDSYITRVSNVSARTTDTDATYADKTNH